MIFTISKFIYIYIYIKVHIYIQYIYIYTRIIIHCVPCIKYPKYNRYMHKMQCINFWWTFGTMNFCETQDNNLLYKSDGNKHFQLCISLFWSPDLTLCGYLIKVYLFISGVSFFPCTTSQLRNPLFPLIKSHLLSKHLYFFFVHLWSRYSCPLERSKKIFD